MQYQISVISAFSLCNTRIRSETVYSFQVDCCLDKFCSHAGQVLRLPSLIQDKKSILKYHNLSPDSNVIFSMHPQPLLVHESAVLG